MWPALWTRGELEVCDVAGEGVCMADVALVGARWKKQIGGTDGQEIKTEEAGCLSGHFHSIIDIALGAMAGGGERTLDVLPLPTFKRWHRSSCCVCH